MTSTDRTTRASFAALNRAEPPDAEFAARLRARVLSDIEPELGQARVVPFQPDPAFATRLRAQLIARLAEPVSERPPSAPVIAAVPRPPRSIRRHRWLDLAAAAVLLIGIISGLASLAPGNRSPGPAAIQAPDTRGPVMLSGSAARDGNYPGPAPASDAYAVRWRDGAVNLEDSVPPSSGLPFGNKLYRFAGEDGIVASSLETNRVIWTAPSASARWMGAVTSVGLLIARDDPDADAMAGPVPVLITLLDLQTGAPIWQSRETYPAAINGQVQLLVSGELVLFQDEQAVVYALDLRSGEELWRHDPRAGQSADDILSSYEPGEECQRRGLSAPRLAITPETTYLFDGIANRIIALATSDGTPRWTVDVETRNGHSADQIDLTATDDGVLVKACAYGGTLGNLQPYLGFWAEVDGAERWQSGLSATEIVIAGDVAFFSFAASANQAECCSIGELDLKTGVVVWSDVSQNLLLDGYLPSANVLVLSRPEIERTVGLDPITHEIVWEHSFLGCRMTLPLADDGAVLCRVDYGTLVLYEPAASAATAPERVMELLDPGTELRTSGVPVTGEDETVWRSVQHNVSSRRGYIVSDFMRPVE